jgi:hypothetical protein
MFTYNFGSREDLADYIEHMHDTTPSLNKTKAEQRYVDGLQRAAYDVARVIRQSNVVGGDELDELRERLAAYDRAFSAVDTVQAFVFALRAMRKEPSEQASGTGD